MVKAMRKRSDTILLPKITMQSSDVDAKDMANTVEWISLYQSMSLSLGVAVPA